MQTDCVILGGGAGGLCAAAALGRRGLRVTVVERLPRVGKKLLATGNGRCNLSNLDMRPSHYGKAAPFVERVYAAVPPLSSSLRYPFAFVIIASGSPASFATSMP